MARLPVFEGFGAELFDMDVTAPATAADPDVLRFASIQRGDVFKLDAHRTSWVCIKRRDEIELFCIKSTQVRNARKWFVARRAGPGNGLIEIYEGAGGDVHPVGKPVDTGIVSDVSVSAVELL